MALISRSNARTSSLINPIISTLRRQISSDPTPITSAPFASHNGDITPSRPVDTSPSELLSFFRTTSLVRRAEIPANSLYNHYGMGSAAMKSPAYGGDSLSGLKVAGQHFMCIKPDNLHMASPLSVFMNSHQPMLKSTYAHFSSSAESQKVPLSGNKHLRPLSPHLSVYKPQSSSMFSIFNRMSAAMLTIIVLSFTLLTMKMGYICLSYAYFYQSFFYLSKLIPISIEISALALAYHLFHSGYLVLKRMK